MYIIGFIDDEDEEVEDIVDMIKGMFGGGFFSEDNGKVFDDLYVLFYFLLIRNDLMGENVV